MRKFFTSGVLAALVAVATSGLARADEPAVSAPSGPQEVELFAAMAAGDVAVKLIPRDAKQANVLIENKTDRPLNIRLPEAFAGVPVLAQFGGGGFGGQQGGFGGGGFGGGQQGFGGGFGGGGGGFGGGGGGFGGGGFGGFMNVGPEKVGKVQVAVVCLEHGKADPNPRVPYEIRPIESFTDNQAAIEVCKMLGRGEIDQASAQAAAWHFTDGLSWQELFAKIGVRRLNGSTEPFFNPVQVQRAMAIAQAAEKRAAEATRNRDSKSDSLSNR